MGRYTGPVEKLERREGVDLALKGERALKRKTSLERRGQQWPGQHGNARRRKTSIYGDQLREAQKLKLAYGLREAQFRRYFERASRRLDVTTGEALLELLERRLDNIVFRLGFAVTRRQARQFVGHGHVLVDGRRVTICSQRLKDGQTVQIRPGATIEAVARDATELVARVPEWLEADHDGLAGTVLRAPRRAEIAIPVAEQLVVERYARR